MKLWGVAATLMLACLPSLAQDRTPLADLNLRSLPDYELVNAGKRVLVRGVVSAEPFHFPDYTLLAIQDFRGGGALEAPKGDLRLDTFRPGDRIEAVGVVKALAGMSVLQPERIELLGRTLPPAPTTVSLQDVLRFPQNLRYLGRLIHVEGPIVEVNDTTAGSSILVGDPNNPYKFFLPSISGQPDLSAFSVGDKAEATGVALQFCPRPPYNHFFELLVNEPTGILVTHRGSVLPPVLVISALAFILCVGFFLWSREHRLLKQRERLRKTFQLGEEVLSSSSAGAILGRISEVLPGILGITGVHLYIYNRAARTLEAAGNGDAEPVSLSLSSPPEGAQASAVACFHYRTLLVIPDVSRSPFPIAGNGRGPTPKSLLLVPMLAQGDVVGVLELDQDDRPRDFTPDEQALAQHLGNQIGVAIRLMDQRSVQEQLFRTEKLAAVGRLISGIVNELQTPLSSISELATKAMAAGSPSGAVREIAAISAEAQKAAAMVSRLVAFGGSEIVEARPVCVPALLRNLIEFRRADWKASGIRVTDLTSRESVMVLGSQGQLEQVFLNLLVHAEQSLGNAPRKAISVRTSVLAKRVLVEISFTAPIEPTRSEETAAVLGVTRSVVGGHGGEIRLAAKSADEQSFEVELPIAGRDRAQPSGTLSTVGTASEHQRRLTALMIEPDEAAQRQIQSLLTARGCRVVPVGNADSGLELAQRMHFDLAFCSVHAPGLNWVELSERMQPQVGWFVLLSDRYDAELSADFEDEGRSVLPKPVQEPELERILTLIDRRAVAKGA